MSVPLDRLYNFLHDVCNRDVVIYRFYPHGSKKITDLTLAHTYTAIDQSPVMMCHDQEPLNWKEYQDETFGSLFRSQINDPVMRYRHLLLLHSEKNSIDLEQFVQDRMIPVYYWSHALIALDWFRYAKLDPFLQQAKPDDKTFLIYQRAWTNTREYRLKFSELLVENNLLACSNVKFNPIDQGQHYTDYEFVNQNFLISNHNLENVLPLNTHSSDASADYNSEDYVNTRIEVVLETLFDDARLHLTEKTLRPVACGQPFILAATPGSLEYVRSYGFKTFAPLIDESYDQETDPVKRLNMIISEMSRINGLPIEEKQDLFSALDQIAKFNQQLFFSQEWQELIVQEFVSNYQQAMTKLDQLYQRRFYNVRPVNIET